MRRKPIIKVFTLKDLEDRFYKGSAPVHLDPEILAKSAQYNFSPDELAENISRQRHAVRQSFHNRPLARLYAKALYDTLMSGWYGPLVLAASPDEIYINSNVTPEFLSESLGHETVHQTLQKMNKQRASKLLDSALGLSATVPAEYNPAVEEMAMLHSQQRTPTPIDEAMKRYKLEGSY